MTQQKKIEISDSVTVTAPGEDRDVQSIHNQLLEEATPGSSPIDVLAHLPSVEVTKADPYGAYECALRINVRGFSQNQLGLTLDDVPLGDMSYGNPSGLQISRALIDEDMGHTVVCRVPVRSPRPRTAFWVLPCSSTPRTRSTSVASMSARVTPATTATVPLVVSTRELQLRGGKDFRGQVSPLCCTTVLRLTCGVVAE